MESSQLVPALFVAAAVYFLYEKTDNNTRALTEEHESVADDLKEDLKLLIDAYYHKYIYPHEYPRYNFVIPSSRSVTHDRYHIHVMINDQSGRLFDKDILMIVGAHECAHMLCGADEVDDHGPVFVGILDKLNELGRELKLYDHRKEIPVAYKALCV